mgnify:CR=1 FL=1|jgi:hypothetical protein|tara:strand:+ start:2550 stop:3071 length:522 start_codon:yes stop_codon:yes gene_type:complete
MTHRVFNWYILFFALLVLASGCASYRLGVANPLIPAGYSIQVGLFQNATFQPGLSDSVNGSIRRELHRDGTFELAGSDDCDVLLTGKITAYRRSPVSFRPKDTLSVRDFVVELSTQVKATEKPSGKLLVDRVITSRTTVRLGDDLASAERQALPLLSSDLAKRTVALLAEGGW